jgi:2-polyprenyl-3-methyl-5-hydroxy-6-metoxy-1,4-benzoquinol methylase
MDYKEHYRIDAESFDYFDKQYQTQTERRRNEEVLHFCTAQAGEKVLDLGSGRGWFAIEMAKRGCMVTAVDLSEKNLEYIHKANKTIECKIGSAYELPFDSERFDWIVMNEVLEHLEEPEKAIEHLKSYLDPNGKVMISVPYKEKINYSLCIHCNKLTPHNAHLHSFDMIQLRKLFRHHGYDVLKEHLYLNKVLTMFKVNELLKFMPFWLWHIKDSAANRIFGKASYLSIIAKWK